MKFFAPGRVNLIGEHIDYNGGNVFPVAISNGTYAEVKIRNDKFIKLFSKNFPEDGDLFISLEENLVKENIWTDYVKGVIIELRKKGFSIETGFDVVVHGNIPNGSGLSSSASLEVLFIKILMELNNLDISDEDISLIAQAAENNFVGVNCGIMDQFIIANGKKDMALNLNCTTLKFEEVPFELGDYKLIIMNTKKRRELADSAYNTRRVECNHGLSIIKKYYDVNEICELHMEELLEIEDEFDKTIFKRLRHAVGEQQRVLDSVKYLKNGDITEFGKLLTASHNSLRDDYEVSCTELDCLVELSLKYGAIGARMIGGGFGGCAIAIVPKHELEKISVEIIANYKKETALDGEIYVVNIVGKAGRYE